MNGDGKPDLVISNYNDNTVSVFLNTTSPGATTPDFALPQTFAAGSNPSGLAVGDVNGDGRPDLVIPDASANSVTVLLNTTAPGSTTVSFAAAQSFATGLYPNWVGLGDINGDGRLDIITANVSSNTVSVLLNTTASGSTVPSFAAQQTFAVGAGPSSLVVGDINGDGKPDIVVADQNSNTVSVLVNTTTTGSSTASFATQQTFVTGSGPVYPALADINGDSKPDIVVANYNSSGTVSVLLNTTTLGSNVASFAAAVTVATTSDPCAAVGDINGDGRPDLLVASIGSSTITVLENTTVPGSNTPSFTAVQTFATGTDPYLMVLGDINGDGKTDLAFSNTGSNTVQVLLNSTPAGALAPSFGSQQTLATGSYPELGALADFNGDGKPDIVVANQNSNTVSVLLNTTAPGGPPPASLRSRPSPPVALHAFPPWKM